MPETRIFVIAAGRNITVQPTRQSFRSNTGTVQVRWVAQGNGIAVGNVSFKPHTPPAPISNLREDPPGSGEWLGDWDTTLEDVFSYSIEVTRNGSPIGPPVDPEIENEPGTVEDDEDKDKGPGPGGG